jgi:putative inorganic carbon (hco3(-)) transporter
MKFLEKTIEYGLYLLVFILPWQTRLIIKAGEINGGYFEYGTVSLYATDVLVFIVLGMFIVYKIADKSQISNLKSQINSKSEIRNSKQIQNSNIKTENKKILEQNLNSVISAAAPSHNIGMSDCNSLTPQPPLLKERGRNCVPAILWFIAGLDLMIFVSIFFAPDKLAAVQGYLRFLLGVGLFWMITSANYSRVKLIYYFLVGATLQACLGLWQFFSQGAVAFKWLGLAGHYPSELGPSVIESINGGRWLRAYGGFDHPNIFGGVMAIGIILIIIEVAREDFIVKKKLERIMLSAMTVLMSAGLFVSFSRAAWLALIVGLATIILITIIKKEKDVLRNVFKISAVCAVVFLILSSVYSELVFTRLGSDARLEVKSNVERVESIVGAKEVIKNNWLFGVGIGNYEKELEISNLKLGIVAPAWDYQPAHDVFLLVWAETGIIGLLFFVGVMVLALITLCTHSNSLTPLPPSPEEGGGIMNISLVVAMVLMMMVDHWIWSLHFGILLFWFVLGIAIVHAKSSASK